MPRLDTLVKEWGFYTDGACTPILDQAHLSALFRQYSDGRLGVILEDKVDYPGLRDARDLLCGKEFCATVPDDDRQQLLVKFDWCANIDQASGILACFEY